MRVAHIEAFGGASGNMLLGAFLDAGASFSQIAPLLRTIARDGWRLERQAVERCGIAATHVDFAIDDDRSDRRLADVLKLLEASQLTAPQKRRAAEVFERLAGAEAKVHGTTVERIHFHEVGALDAILDVASTCIALDLLGVDRLSCSALPIGSGSVRMKHGRYPNPPPATAELLLGIPAFDAEIEGELVTPTGAALLSTLCVEFGRRPSMRTQAIGYGAGTMNLTIPNVTRVSIGEALVASETPRLAERAEISVIEANIDDMSPQYYELAMERIFEAGAKDVWLSPVTMKKGRPAITLSAIASSDEEAAVARTILRETTTIGVRVRTERKYAMVRESGTVETEFGAVRTKRSALDGAEARVTVEYDDLVRIARAERRPIREIAERIEAEVHAG